MFPARFATGNDSRVARRWRRVDGGKRRDVLQFRGVCKRSGTLRISSGGAQGALPALRSEH